MKQSLTWSRSSGTSPVFSRVHALAPGVAPSLTRVPGLPISTTTAESVALSSVYSCSLEHDIVDISFVHRCYPRARTHMVDVGSVLLMSSGRNLEGVWKGCDVMGRQCCTSRISIHPMSRIYCGAAAGPTAAAPMKLPGEQGSK
nr:hypothetical protein CFP56_23954 [Quercus suber]